MLFCRFFQFMNKPQAKWLILISPPFCLVCVRQEIKQSILQKFNISTMAYSKKYLGLPTMIGRSKNGAMQQIKDRIWKRIKYWKEKLISRGDKKILIKVVALAIPTYTMSCFLIPSTICKDMENMMWWYLMLRIINSNGKMSGAS